MAVAIQLESSFYKLIPNDPFLFPGSIEGAELVDSAGWQNCYTHEQNDCKDDS